MGKKHLGCQAGKRSNSAIDHDLANTKHTGQAIGMYVMGVVDANKKVGVKSYLVLPNGKV